MRIQGLSLIEILIAILVFAVGILAILQMIIKTITTVDTISLQTQATILATQGMEITRTLRNTNIMKGLPRDCAQGTIQGGDFVCDIKFAEEKNLLRVAMQHKQIADTNPYIMVESLVNANNFEENFSTFQLYAHTGTLNGDETQLTRYDHDSTNAVPTNFARYMQIRSKPSIDGTYVLGVDSVVLIQKGSYTGSIVMESLIGKIYE